MKKKIAILGVSGSIGKNTLSVIQAEPDNFEVVLVQANKNEDALARAAAAFPEARPVLSSRISHSDFFNIIQDCRADIVVNGIAGAAGLGPSIAALNAGADLALANKETVVMAGALVFALAERRRSKIIPVDSEHAAIYRLLKVYCPEYNKQGSDLPYGDSSLAEIILTASGGPFRDYTIEELQKVTVADALKHPTWNMGKKITIDSASLANKGLEVIEAVRLFSVPPEKVRVVIHPQSVVHSMVRLNTGAVYAQLSKPDMRLPIHEALFDKDAPQDAGWSAGVPPWELDFDDLSLSFAQPDMERFPMLSLAYESLRKGGLYPVAYNAANEAAVEAFINQKSGFLEINRKVEYALSKNWIGDEMNLDAIIATDKEARSLCL
jgi:1-deoxy-D-xylulose-5-phosphate reductoisomerase